MDSITQALSWAAGAVIVIVIGIRAMFERKRNKEAGRADERERNAEEREKQREKVQQADKVHRDNDSDEHRKWLLERAKARNKSD